MTSSCSQCAVISVDVDVLSCQFIASLPPTQFTHQSNNPNACPRMVSWLVLQCCMLSASDFHQSRLQTNKWQADIAIDQQGHQSGVVITVVMSILWLQRFVSCWCWDWPWWKSFVGGLSLYDVIITTRCRQSVRHLLVIDLPQLDQFTSCTSMHLTRRLRADTVGVLGDEMFIISVFELFEIAVRIIENGKNNFVSAKKSCLNY